MTLANALTASRLVLTPVIVVLIVSGYGWAAAAVFAAAAITDFFDGRLARATNTVSDFGKNFDPLVDRIFIGGAAIAILFTPSAPPYEAVAILVVRDLTMFAGFRYLRWRNITPPPVVFTGKLATAFLMTSLPTLLIFPRVGMVLFFIGLVLSLVAGLNYVVKGIEAATSR